MARVTVEDCIDKVDNRFDLVLMASHRARAISSGAPISVQRDNDKNPVVALREIGDGKLSPWRSARGCHPRPAEARRDRRTGGRGGAADGQSESADPDRAWRRGSVRPHDGRGFAARARRPDASAGAGGRWRVATAVVHGCRRGALASRCVIPSARLGRGGIFLLAIHSHAQVSRVSYIHAAGDLLSS